MAKYLVTMPLVGYSYVTVEAEDKEEALEKAYEICCDWDENEDVECGEFYGIERVVEGNVCSHPQWRAEVEEVEEE